MRKVFRLARRIALAIIGAANLVKPDGSSRLRSAIRVPPFVVSSHVQVVSIGKGLFGGAHDEPFAGHQLLDLVGVCEATPEETRAVRRSTSPSLPRYFPPRRKANGAESNSARIQAILPPSTPYHSQISWVPAGVLVIMS